MMLILVSVLKAKLMIWRHGLLCHYGPQPSVLLGVLLGIAYGPT